MTDKQYDNLIRKANQRLSRAQKSGFGETYEVRQLYLARLRGSKDIVINKKGQLQFRRSKNISDETWELINKVATRENYTEKGLKKNYEQFVESAKRTGMTQQDAIRRVMATYNDIKNKFEYHDALEVINKLGEIKEDTVREEKLKEVEEFLNKNYKKYEYADELKKAFDKKQIFKGDFKAFQDRMSREFFNG